MRPAGSSVGGFQVAEAEARALLVRQERFQDFGLRIADNFLDAFQDLLLQLLLLAGQGLVKFLVRDWLAIHPLHCSRESPAELFLRYPR